MQLQVSIKLDVLLGLVKLTLVCSHETRLSVSPRPLQLDPVPMEPPGAGADASTAMRPTVADGRTLDSLSSVGENPVLQCV